jgi:hypothetical protein
VNFEAPYCNYGDYVQSVAIEYLYGLMDIPERDIVHIGTKDLAAYDGEQLLLPYNYVLHFLVGEDGRVRLSERITPVFLGASVEFAMLINSYPLGNFASPDKKWIETFRKYAPIGCRDAFSRRFIASLGVPAYLQGCITNIFPRRPEGDYRKVLLVDCPSEVLPYIPEGLLDHVEVLSNAAYIGDLSVEENYQKIKRRYDYYRDNAVLVVTSRYHVATPCNAMGIPAIFVRRSFDKHSEDIRLDTLHPNIQLCSGENFSGIDWRPRWLDFEALKSDITRLAMARIREAYERHTKTEKIREHFRSRIDEYERIKKIKVAYQTRLSDFILHNYAPPAAGRFYLWGAIPLLCDGSRVVLADLIGEANPGLEFAGWIDTFKSGTLANKPIIKPDSLHLAENEFVVVAAETAIPDALALFQKMGLGRERYLILANTMVEKADLEKGEAQAKKNNYS